MMKMSRRSFLKGSAGTLATIALATGAGVGIKAFETTAATSDTVEWKPAFCGFCHFPTCATQVKVVNGVAMEIRGDKNSESNRGKLCTRGISALANLYNPYRVKSPMKRTNPEKGIDIDPGWVEISWEEALDMVAQKVKEACDEDPRSVLYTVGFGVEESFMTAPIFIALGTPNVLNTPGPTCPEHFNQLHLNGMMLDRVDMQHAEYILEIGRTNGSNYALASASHTSHYADALEKGVKFVTVDPHCNNSAQRGEWVPIMPGTDAALGLALLYTIIHEIGIYDENYLKVHTNSPYLLDPSFTMIKGRKVYKETYLRDAEGKPLVWDENLKKAVPFDTSKGETYALLGTYEVEGKTVHTAFQILTDFIKDYTPEWAEPITTIPAAKIREIANDLISHARIGSTINIEGFEFPYRPSAVFMGRGMASHMLGVEAAKALGTVNVLLGNLDVPGGIQGCYNASWDRSGPDKDGILEPKGLMFNQVTGEDIVFPPDLVDMGNFYPMRHAGTPLAWKTILDPQKYHIEYPINVYLIHGGDPVGSNVNGTNVQRALKKIPFTVSIAYHYDLPTQFADVLLPESSTLEKDSIYRMCRNEKECTNETIGLMGTLVKKPVVENVFNSKVAEDIYIEICERAGKLADFNMAWNHAPLINKITDDKADGLKPEYFLEPTKKYTWRECIERKIASDYGPEAIKEFDECAFKPDKLTLKESYNYYFMPDNTVRLPIYYERMVRNGERMMAQLKAFNVTVPNQDMDHVYSFYSGMPLWYDNAGYETTEEYPFKAVNWKIHYGVNNTGGLYDNAYMQEIIDYSNPFMKCIHVPASTAAELGIKEGDMVCLESRFGGKTQGKVHLSEFLHPKCLGIPGNFGRRTPYMNPSVNTGVHFNSLLSDDESTINPISMALEASPQVKIYKI
jgi:anaerobic selenocysteine-containing dehydrogenase